MLCIKEYECDKIDDFNDLKTAGELQKEKARSIREQQCKHNKQHYRKLYNNENNNKCNVQKNYGENFYIHNLLNPIECKKLNDHDGEPLAGRHRQQHILSMRQVDWSDSITNVRGKSNMYNILGCDHFYNYSMRFDLNDNLNDEIHEHICDVLSLYIETNIKHKLQNLYPFGCNLYFYFLM